MTETKMCSLCGRVKPADEFNRNKASKDGRQAYCRKCYNEYQNDRNKVFTQVGRRKRKYGKVDYKPEQPRWDPSMSMMEKLFDEKWLLECIAVVMAEAEEREKEELNRTEKVCLACQELRPISEFSKHPASADKLQYNCKKCLGELTRRRRDSKKS